MEMMIDLNELRERDEPLQVEGDFTEDQLKLRNDVSGLGRAVRSGLRLSFSGDRLLVSGALDTELELTCCRCLKRFRSPLAKRFDLEYWPDPKVEAESEELELTYQDLQIGFYRGDSFDLTAVISEQVVLEVPMKPVCMEGCRGLCDQCGKDLNEGGCDCPTERLDPRLQVLASLRKRMK